MKVIKKLLTNPTSLAGILLLLAFAVLAVAAPWIAPPPENSRDPSMIPRAGFKTEPASPSADHGGLSGVSLSPGGHHTNLRPADHLRPWRSWATDVPGEDAGNGDLRK